MTITQYKWDIDALNIKIQQLKKEKIDLENNRQFLVGLKDEVQQDWICLAGTTYTKSLELDIQNYDRIIESLNEGIGILDKITNQTYVACEYTVKQKISEMITRMGR